MIDSQQLYGQKSIAEIERSFITVIISKLCIGKTQLIVLTSPSLNIIITSATDHTSILTLRTSISEISYFNIVFLNVFFHPSIPRGSSYSRRILFIPSNCW